MKFLAIFVVITLFAATQGMTDEQRARRDKVSAECREKSGVTIEMVEKARKGETIEDPKMKAHILCICVKAGVMTESGDIHKDILKTKLNGLADGEGHEDKINKAVEECAAKKTTPEETALHMLNCIYKNHEGKEFHITN